MGILKDLNFVCGDNSKASTIFENLFPGKTFLDIEYLTPSNYVNMYWEKYKKIPEPNSNLNGKIFEYIISTLLYRENLVPLYMQAKVAFVPNVEFDILLYSKECGSISLSLKTSLRERYKQADLEAIALKYVHRKAKTYLLTLEQNEAANIKSKIKSGDVIGLDEIVVCSMPEFDEMIKKLKKYELTLAGTVDIIKSSQIVTK